MTFRMKVRCLLLALLLLPADLVAGQALGAMGGAAGVALPAAAPDGKGYVTCWKCHGDGKATCSWCNGAGRIYQGNGRYKACSTCSGSGKVRCSRCGGTGVERR
jgi:hypothetical protein